jgi:hypothetical protein
MFIKFGDKTKNIIVKKACPSRAYKKGTPNSCSCNPPCGLEDSEENTIYLDDSDDEKKEDRRLKILKEYDNK